jgi:hypothetical protein
MTTTYTHYEALIRIGKSVPSIGAKKNLPKLTIPGLKDYLFFSNYVISLIIYLFVNKRSPLSTG